MLHCASVVEGATEGRDAVERAAGGTCSAFLEDVRLRRELRLRRAQEGIAEPHGSRAFTVDDESRKGESPRFGSPERPPWMDPRRALNSTCEDRDRSCYSSSTARPRRDPLPALPAPTRAARA